MPICLPIPKLAALPAATKTARFKSGLLAPNSNRIQGVSYLREVYAKIASEWGRSPEHGRALYAFTEPNLRELLIGMAASREVKFASYDFDTAEFHAASGNYGMANLYFSYALAKLHRQLDSKTKLGYGYDISGEVGERGGTSGQQRHQWDTGNAPKHDHTQNNPANMMFDAEAESDYPELAEFKHKRVYWPPRTR